MVLVLFICWQTALAIYWQRGWDHYEAGGGVFVYDDLNRPEMEKALDAFRTGAKLNPFSLGFRNYTGQALIELERYEEALAEFDKSLTIYSGSFTAHYERAYVLMKLKRYLEMVKSLRDAISLNDPLNSSVRFSTEFGDIKNEPFMKEFQNQY
jgi:tetratricopeptide (TPR) repeat protein